MDTPKDIENSKTFVKLSAIELLQRPPTEKYINEWTELLKKEKGKVRITDEQGTAILIFRLKNELLALPSVVFSEVIAARTIHHVPYRSNNIILGVVNIKGQMRLCVAMDNFLQIQENEKKPSSESSQFMLTIDKQGEQWVFPVDEIFGIYQLSMDQVRNPPVTITKSTANYLKGVFTLHDKIIGLLDEVLLSKGLRRCVK